MSCCDSDALSPIISTIPPATFVRPPGRDRRRPPQRRTAASAPRPRPPVGRGAAVRSAPARGASAPAPTLDLSLRLRPEAAERLGRAVRLPDRPGPGPPERSRSTVVADLQTWPARCAGSTHV